MIERLTAALSPTRLVLDDQSEQHIGHAGHDARGESHFALIIESPRLPQAGPHRSASRQVYAALGDPSFTIGLMPLGSSGQKLREKADGIRNDHPRPPTIWAISRSAGPCPRSRGRMVGPFIFFDQFGPARLPPGTAWTSAPTRTSTSPPSPICSRARSTTATASAAADPAGRDQPDDRRPRHRPFGALARRARADGP